MLSIISIRNVRERPKGNDHRADLFRKHLEISEVFRSFCPGLSRLNNALEEHQTRLETTTWTRFCLLGARLTATQRSKKGSEKVLGRVLGKGS